MPNEQMQEAIKELQDAVVVMAHIEKRQSEMLKDLAEWRYKTELYMKRTEQNLAEITDKLNGIIGFSGGPNLGIKQ